MYNFFQTEDDYDFFYIYDGTYENKSEVKRYHDDLGDISYEWSAETVTFYWKTDGSTQYSSMIAYIDFWK